MKRKLCLVVLLVVMVICLVACQQPIPEKGETGAAGKDGKSAYELAVDKGYTGTEEEWLQSLVGVKGDTGANGKSAYELAVEKGYTGSEAEWLASLVGGNGKNGKSAYELAVENGYEGDLTSWLLSLVGQKGDKGDKGDKGEVGADGKSAYEVAVSKGYTGTEEEWLASLKGQDLTACEHNWSDWTDEFAADCSSVGSQTRTCAKCGSMQRKIVAAVGHDWTLFQNVVEKTCTQDGIAYFDCSQCGIMQLRVYKSSGHELETHAAQKNTCTQIGWKEYQTCKNCDYTTYEELPASHDVVDGVCTMCKKAYQTDGFEFEMLSLSGDCSVTGVKTQTADRLIIPSTTPEGYPVTEIAQEAFKNTDYIEVIVPHNVEIIRENAFAYCSKLLSVTLPDSLQSIYDKAFYECNKLVEVINGSQLDILRSSYDGYVAYYALNVKKSRYNDTDIKEKDGYLFYTHDETNYLLGYTGAEAELTLPSNYNGESYRLYERAFENYAGLTSVVIPEGITEILESTFSGCSGLTDVTLASGVTSIGQNAFYDCGGLRNIYYNGDIAGWCAISDLISLMSSPRALYIGGKKVEGNLVIPKGVTSIGDSAFAYCIGLTSVEIPNTVASIGNFAFAACPFFTSIEIPNSVTSIGDYAFQYCQNLTSITIPGSVESIGSGLFYECDSLTDIYYMGNLAEWCVIKRRGALNRYRTDVSLHIDGKKVEGELVIPDGVTTIENYAFLGLRGLTSVVIPDSVATIGNDTFSNCWGLTSVTIGRGLEIIYTGAFGNCAKLVEVINNSGRYLDGFFRDNEDVNIKNGGRSDIVNQNGYLFYTRDETNYLLGYNGAEKELVLPENYNGQQYQIYKYAFYGNGGLTSVIIPNSVTLIGGRAFSGCGGLTNVTIPEGVRSIEHSAFEGCGDLTNITIPRSVVAIGSNAFYNCSNLKNVYYTGNVARWCAISGLDNLMSSLRTLYIDGTKVEGNLVIPKGVTSISDGAFAYCSALTSVEIPDTVTSIGNSAFSRSGLISIEIPNSVTSIGDYAFYGCSGLANVAISNSVEAIGVYTFTGCGLTNVTISSGVKSIGEGAFLLCESLVSIEIPDSVTWIDERAFSYCSGLTSIKVLDGNAIYHSDGNCLIETASKTLILGCKNSVIPTDGSVTRIGSYAFSGSDLTSVTIGSDITSIDYQAFYDCIKLVEVINNSSLSITKGSSSNGYVAYYALNVKNGGSSEVVNQEGYLFYTYDNVNYLLGYVGVGTETELTLPENYNGQNYQIYEYAFYNCNALTSVTIGSGVTSIGSYAFSGSDLTSVTIGSGVTSIGSYAFSGSDLTSVTIGSGVKTIGDWAFYGCSGLKTVYYKGGEKEWGKISIDFSNGNLTSATRYYYSETEPALNADGTAYDGNYWHYDTDGTTPVIWKKEN